MNKPTLSRATAAARPLAALLAAAALAACGGGGAAEPAPGGGLAAPALGSIAAPVPLFVGQRISAIAFANTGGGSITGCAPSPALPGGLTAAPAANGSTCQITGVPNAAAARATYTVTATNAGGTSMATVDIAVSAQPGGDVLPSLASITGVRVLTAGQAAPAITFANSGGGELSGCTVSPALPGGLAAAPATNGSTCQITGTPNAAAARATYTVTATNATGTSMATVDIAVTAQPGGAQAPMLANIAAALSLTVGQRAPITTFTNTGGGALTGCAPSPALPMGLAAAPTANSSTCQITGLPTAAAARATYTVTATNATGTSMATVDIAVTAQPGSVSPPVLPSSIMLLESVANRLTPLSFTFTNTGGGSITGCTSVPMMPAGLTLEPTMDGMSCQITGRPTVVTHTVRYNITATNSGGSSSALFDIRLYPPTPVLVISGSSTVSFPVGDPITAISIDNSVIGSLTECTVMPDLPDGLEAVVSTDRRSCLIQGTPQAITAQMTYTVTGTIRVGGSTIGSDTADVTIAITKSLKPALEDIGEPQVYAVGDTIDTIEFVNSGTGSLTGCSVSPDLPMGLALAPKADDSTCQITGMVGAVGAGVSHVVTGANAQGAGGVTGTVDIVVLAVGALSQAVDSGAAFGTSGQVAWAGQTAVSNDDVDAARITGLDGGSASCLHTRVSQPGLVGFHWRIDSPGGAPDTLDFSVGGEESARIEGTAPWAQAFADVDIPQGGGARLLSWCGRKHSGGQAASGSAYIDQFTLTPRPQGLIASVVSETELRVSWSAFPGATHYQVFRNEDGGDPMAEDEITSGTGQTSTSYSDAGLTKNTLYHYWVKSCDADGCTPFSAAAAARPREADGDGDALIEVASLFDLDSIRYNPSGTSLKVSAGDPGNTLGCPSGGCVGYELTASLDFDADGDGGTWEIGEDGAATLDGGDSDGRYFDAGEGGWLPIGAGSGGAITVILEGNGHTISNLASSRDLPDVGLFGNLGEDSQVRNLGLVNSLAHFSGDSDGLSYIGALAGRAAGDITAVYSSGLALGQGGSSVVGGLIGRQGGGHTMASFATGAAGGGGWNVGGLVGELAGAAIDSCYATGPVQGRRQGSGGLVGSIAAGATVTASYASGDVNAGGASDPAGSLAGRVADSNGVVASWGFGKVNGSGGSSGSGLPAGVTLARHLSAQNAPDPWKNATTPANGAWDFGAAAEGPALAQADYDNDGTGFYCQGGAALAALAGADVQAAARARQVAGCSTMPTLIAGQRQVPVPGPVRITVTSATSVGLAWDAVVNATSYEVQRNTTASIAGATELTAGATAHTQASYADSGLTEGAGYHYWVRGCGAAGCSGYSPAHFVTMREADSDSDGLIDILGLADLNSVRHNLAGDFFAENPAVSNAVGCPSGGCTGYELMVTADLDFDADADGATWATIDNLGARSAGNIATLDAGDDNDDYFDVEGGGWVPIGNCGADELCADNTATLADEAADNAAFNAVFEGNGKAIRNLAVLRSHRFSGLFGALGSDAEVRNLNVLDALAIYKTPLDETTIAGQFAIGTSTSINNVGLLAGYSEGAVRSCRSSGFVGGFDGSNDFLGGLVGRVNGGTVTDSSSSASLYGAEGSDFVGGLVGHMDNGSITASYATGTPRGGRASEVFGRPRMDVAGGLVGRMGDGSITASYALARINISGPGFTNSEGNFRLDHSGFTDEFGGLVGRMGDGSITASYAQSIIDAGRGPNDVAGGLVGRQMGGSITASYARGRTEAGIAFHSVLTDQDRVGALVGWQEGGTATDSWGYGDVVGGEVPGVNGSTGSDGMDNRPASSDVALTASNVPSTWNDSASGTEAAWIFGNAIVHTPALNYADYDGSGNAFHCEGAASPPAGAVLVPNCEPMATVIPGQRDPAAPGGLAYTQTQITNVTLTWDAVLNAEHFRIYRSEMPDSDTATELTTAQTRVTQTSLDGGNSFAITLTMGDGHYYWIAGCNGDGDDCGARSRPVFLNARQADSDGNGLIEIYSNRDLFNMHYSLDGAKLVTYPGDPGTTAGCPMTGGCVGYELMANLDLEEGDPVVNVSNWFPVGNCGPDLQCFDRSSTEEVDESVDNVPFTAIFDGNGRTISNLRTRINSSTAIGLFGLVSADAEIRNVGLLDVNLSFFTNIGGILAYLGGLVGYNEGARIVACYATGEITGSDRATNRVGGLVGVQLGGAIVASFANVTTRSGSLIPTAPGGLVAIIEDATIAASYASGDLTGAVNTSTIIASYSTSKIDNGNRQSTITDSYGFSVDGNGDPVVVGGTPPAGVTAATGLTAANAPDSWSDAATPAMGAWDFGDSEQAPALNYADYDGPTTTAGDGTTSGDDYHCAGAASPPDGAALVANCATGPMLIPNQRAAAAPGQ